ncbi:MAG: hypothetical protein WCK37_00990 [Candidatus Falkowbacteria bacterium]
MATKQQIPVLAARLVEFQEGFYDLPNEDAQWAIMHAKEAVRLCVSVIKNRHKVQTVSNNITCSIDIRVTPEKFIAKERFVVDTSETARIKISYLGRNFIDWFGEKIEDSFPGSSIVGRKLIESSLDTQIINELGGERFAETTLMEINTAMWRQANGEFGELSTKGEHNVFYVRDVKGILRTVSVYWDPIACWCVDAVSIDSFFGHDAGCRVFSRE